MPRGPAESHGMEDARFVRFAEDDGTREYLATYTAYDGARHRLAAAAHRTTSARSTIIQLSGPGSRNKGLALFPRRVGGRYLARVARRPREQRDHGARTTCGTGTSPSSCRRPSSPGRSCSSATAGRRSRPRPAGSCSPTGSAPMRRLQHRRPAARPRRPDRGARPADAPAAHARRGRALRATCPTSSTRAARCCTGARSSLPYGCSDTATRFGARRPRPAARRARGPDPRPAHPSRTPHDVRLPRTRGPATTRSSHCRPPTTPTRRRPTHLRATPRTDKPWGHEMIFAAGEHGYVGKVIIVDAGQALSLQLHEAQGRDDQRRLRRGGRRGRAARSTCCERTTMIAGDTVHIPPGVLHRITAVTDVLSSRRRRLTPGGITTSSASRTTTAAAAPRPPEAPHSLGSGDERSAGRTDPSTGRATSTFAPSALARPAVGRRAARASSRRPPACARSAPATRSRPSPTPTACSCVLDSLPRCSTSTRPPRPSTVGAGDALGRARAGAHAHGLALHNLGSLPHISVAGVGVDRHARLGRPATAASPPRSRALDLVTADGDLRTISRGEPTSTAAVVALGALGIVTALTLDLQPDVRHRADGAGTACRGTRARALRRRSWRRAYSVSLFTDVERRRVEQVWVKRRTDGDAADLGWTGGSPAPTARGIRSPASRRTACTEQGGVRRAVVRAAAALPARLHAEQRRRAADRVHGAAIACARRARGRARASPRSRRVLQISEIRTVAADDLWLSPCEGRDTSGIHFTWVDDAEAVAPAVARGRAGAAPYDARPHWGKVFTHRPDVGRAPSTRGCADFEALRARARPATASSRTSSSTGTCSADLSARPNAPRNRSRNASIGQTGASAPGRSPSVQPQAPCARAPRGRAR